MENNTEKQSRCPVTGATGKHSAAIGGTKNANWWPNQLNLGVLRQHSCKSNPMDGDFNYTDEFK